MCSSILTRSHLLILRTVVTVKTLGIAGRRAARVLAALPGVGPRDGESCYVISNTAVNRCNLLCSLIILRRVGGRKAPDCKN